MVKRTASVAYHQHGILLNLSPRRKHWLIDSRHMLVRFTPLRYTQEQLEKAESVEHKEVSLYVLISSMAVPQETGVRVTLDLLRRKLPMRVNQQATKVVLGLCRNVT